MKVVTDSKNYTDIASAIREKGVEGSFKPAEMAAAIESIEGGGGVPDYSLVVTQLSAGKPSEVVWYGEEIPDYALTYYAYQARRLLKRGTPITRIGNAGLQNATVDIASDFFDEILYLGEYALAFDPTNINTFTIPKWNGKDINGKIQGSVFRRSSHVTKYILPSMQYIGDYLWYQRTDVLSVQIGSIGKGVLQCNQRPFGSTKGTATIEIYVDGAHLDAVSTAITNQASATYTFIFKASEDTTYNGTAYSAGDTMLTIGS